MNDNDDNEMELDANKPDPAEQERDRQQLEKCHAAVKAIEELGAEAEPKLLEAI